MPLGGRGAACQGAGRPEAAPARGHRARAHAPLTHPPPPLPPPRTGKVLPVVLPSVLLSALAWEGARKYWGTPSTLSIEFRRATLDKFDHKERQAAEPVVLNPFTKHRMI